MQIDQVIQEMQLVFKDIPYGVEHTMRVLDNAGEIITGELLDEETKQIIVLAAILHDIGAIAAQMKYHSMEGHFQEIEGPPIAKAILERARVVDGMIERVCYIVGNHHSPSKIDGVDFQILWEADVLDNLEFGEQPEAREELRIKIAESFRTSTGTNMALKRCGDKL